ncbi:MAG: hypothetical protein KME13_27385 [Myxacorys californica WJT36-NPBG1]|nr:hypothetical protein [Myxacorys californica WJT36-NPBG1]
MFTPDEFAELFSQMMAVTVEHITAIAILKQAGHSDTELWLPLDLGFSKTDEASYLPSIEEVTIAIARHHSLDPGTLADLLEASFFSPSEDSDADSYDTQQEDFRESAQERSIRVLLSEDEALRARIEMVVDRHLRWVIPSNMKVEVRVLPISEAGDRPLFNRSVEVIHPSSPEPSQES